MRTRDSSRCPDPEVLAAFVAGTLSEEELRMTAEHIRNCEDCAIILAETAKVDREQGPDVASTPPPMATMPRHFSASPWWLVAAAAALFGLAFLVLYQRMETDKGITILVVASPRAGRYVEPRLSGGFPWAPLRPVQRATTEVVDPEQMKLVGAAGTVLEKTQGDPSVEARHATALAHLLTGRADQANMLLAKSAEKTGSVSVWSDLAAARYVESLQTDNPARLAEALVAADAALTLAPDYPEALFNRALIVERLGLRDEARTAWQRYLAADSSSAWAREAKNHLARLTPPVSFKDELERLYDGIARDASAAAALVHRFPQETRVWGESEILGRWAAAWQGGRHGEAKQHLRVAREFGDELAESRAEFMLSAAVDAIERADAKALADLAAAHLDFRQAQKIYGQGRPADAQLLFESSAALFARRNSPLALVARYFLANTRYDQGHVTEARGRLQQLRAEAPPRFPAHRAQVEWQLGLVHASLAAWGPAMDTLSQSVAGFERLRERPYATAVREILAEVYDRVGNPRAAWRHRINVLQEIGAVVTPKLLVTVDAAARGAALDGDWPVSLALLKLEADMAQESGDPLLRVQTYLFRARIQERLGRHQDARSDLRAAKALIPHLKDNTFRERAFADCGMVEAYLAPPQQAVQLFSNALLFNETKGRRMLLPDLFLHRGRALEALARKEEATADFEAGITELEKQRSSIAAGEDRWGTFGTAEGLFEEAIANAIASGRVDAAFAYSERARARELLESMRASSDNAISASRAADAVIIEYASLPASLVIFVLHRGTVRAVQHVVARSALEEELAELKQSVSEADGVRFRRKSASLYGHLVAPVAAYLSTAGHLAIIPDATLRSVPFAALMDPTGRYLVERHAISTSPSAAVFTHFVTRQTVGAFHDVLVIEGPRSGDPTLRHLRAANREAAAVAALYPRAERIASASADEATFASRASAITVLHFVGHAVSGDGPYAALITSTRRDAQSDGRLDVREIAAMSLARTRLVVLAACSTATGEERGAEGNISVARAFVAAGVPSVVATLWAIDDEQAAEFFPRLHRHLIRGHSAAEALRATQIESIRSRSAPAVWAAMQVNGM